MKSINIFFGPQTLNILNAILEYDVQYPNRTGIITSRNQVESKKYGSSYLFDNKSKFVKYVKKKTEILKFAGIMVEYLKII